MLKHNSLVPLSDATYYTKNEVYEPRKDPNAEPRVTNSDGIVLEGEFKFNEPSEPSIGTKVFDAVIPYFCAINPLPRLYRTYVFSHILRGHYSYRISRRTNFLRYILGGIKYTF
jgi:hypothetical protein